MDRSHWKAFLAIATFFCLSRFPLDAAAPTPTPPPGPPPAATGTVHLLSGETLDGKLLVSNNQIQVSGKGGATSADLSNVFNVVFAGRGVNKDGQLVPGAVLVNGSQISGTITTTPSGIDDPVKLSLCNVPLASVAWAVVGSVSRNLLSKPSPGQTGAILPGGDFFPGTVQMMGDDKVAINSILLGPQRFVIKGPKTTVVALVLRDIQPVTGRYEVSLRDGSFFLTNDLISDSGGITIRDSVAGDVHIPYSNLSRIDLSKNLYQYATALKPDRVDVPKGMDAATAVQGPKDGASPDAQILQTAPNAAVTYSIPQGCTVFSANAVVPKEAPPGAKVTFAVYGDGRALLARSGLIGAGDNPQRIRVSLANLHNITLRVEPAAGTGITSAQWVQPIFMKP